MINGIRPQNEPRPLFELDEDYMRGLKSTTDNAQPLMALMYVHKAVEDLLKKVRALESEIMALKSGQSDTKPARGRKAAEETPAEA